MKQPQLGRRQFQFCENPYRRYLFSPLPIGSWKEREVGGVPPSALGKYDPVRVSAGKAGARYVPPEQTKAVCQHETGEDGLYRALEFASGDRT